MRDAVSGPTARGVRLGEEVVTAAAEFASATGTTAERVLGLACAAFVARLCRTDGAGGEPLPVALLPDGGADLVVGPVPHDVAEALDSRIEGFVAAALAEPQRPLSEVELVDDTEWALLTAWAGPDRPPVEQPVHRMFAAWAQKQPDAVAVSTHDAELTYRELLEYATGIAHALAERGVRPGDPVGILLDRGLTSVAAMVGVAMAAATAVPLDPAYPEPRLRLMMSGPGVRTTLTSEALAGRVPVGTALVVEGVEPSVAPLEPAEAEVATVMYTSGSTGTPKGVQLSHRGIARLTADDRIDFGPEDVVLHLAPATFDAALLEVWCALALGARLHVAPAGPLTLGELADVVTGRGITVLWLTAGLFHQMAEHEPDAFSSVRRLFSGGDVVSPHHVNSLLTRHPGLTVVNGYGPTENTTFTCCHLMREPLPPGTATVPIGTPVHSTRVFLVDRGGHPVPPGVPGELWAEGAGLAAGYLGLPEQSAERFHVPESGRLRGLRCYRTGDLARFRADGILEFLGREDGQAKVNGHRIEPGEIEQAILAQPGVRGACVLVETDALGGKRLAAHIAGDDKSLAKAVRAALRDSLPAYLVPARYIVTERLPLTVNGKTDRARLLAGESEPR
ncbi:amino acid adenylation domain-containing protein [Streptomyces sp. NPDC001493]